MRLFLYLIVLFLAFPSQSQNKKDFIITTTRDTIYGEIYWYSGSKISMKVDGEKKAFSREEILGYKDANRLYEVIKITYNDGKVKYEAMQVLTDGKMRLLLHCPQCRTYYILFNKEAIFVNADNLKEKIFSRLEQCENFKTASGEYTSMSPKQLSRNEKKLKRMVMLYNSGC